MADLARKVDELIREALEDEGFELVHVEFLPYGASPILRVYVDREGGITLSHCADISRLLGPLLDVEDVIPTHYVLEVSSPGIERPLFSEQDYRRFKGREIRMTTLEKFENQRNFRGIIDDFVGRNVRLRVQDRVLEIPLDRVKKANLVYDFDAKPTGNQG